MVHMTHLESIPEEQAIPTIPQQELIVMALILIAVHPLEEHTQAELMGMGVQEPILEGIVEELILEEILVLHQEEIVLEEIAEVQLQEETLEEIAEAQQAEEIVVEVQVQEE